MDASQVSTGRYILWRDNHFVAVFVSSDAVTVYDGDNEPVVSSVQIIQDQRRCLWFKLESIIDSSLAQRLRTNRAEALTRRAHRLMTWTRSASPYPATLSQEQLGLLAANRASALARRCAQLHRPLPPMGWRHPANLPVPTMFHDFPASLPEISWLAQLNEHVRDHQLKFVPASHRYFVAGLQTLGSVTGLIHTVVEEFDAEAVIERMRGGRNWPRPGYLRQPPSQDVLLVLQRNPTTQHLVALLQQSPMDEEAVCVEAKRVMNMSPETSSNIHDLSLGSQEIMDKWDSNRNEAANRGTWMHYQMERYLNWAAAHSESPELAMLIKFTRGLAGLTAYRTEWAIYGEEERLAGSIDFVAEDSSRKLVLFDWKRSRNLRSKYSCPWRKMKSPCEHLDDCTGIHYRLQLNCYKYLLEKYYDKAIRDTPGRGKSRRKCLVAWCE